MTRAAVRDDALRAAIAAAPLAELMRDAAALRDVGHGPIVSYSRKVFIPLTRLCRDVCHYCTFATGPRDGRRGYLSIEEVVAIARAGERAGCTEALFTLGERPELRYRAARDELDRLGQASTLSYLVAACDAVLRETTLLPHVNPGTLTADEFAALRRVSVSAGMMLETTAARLGERGGVHFGSPDKHPAVRLRSLHEAGRQGVPFTTGLLVGIGETRAERLDALFAIRDAHRAFGHVQEVIIQPFRAKPATRMASHPEPDRDELLWTVAAARLVLGAAMNIQAPPNLAPEACPQLIRAGLNDWGGVSPVTPDHVNPEAPWPGIAALDDLTRREGKTLVARLPLYPAYCRAPERWLDAALRGAVLRVADGEGFARDDAWSPGSRTVSLARPLLVPPARIDPGLAATVAAARRGADLREDDIVRLLHARGGEAAFVIEAADALRQESVGPVVRYVVNRNINYTNVCTYRCGFCAFSKGRTAEHLRGRPYELSLDDIAHRAAEAWARGATEVCMQGGIHPAFDGGTYLDICRAASQAAPGIHVHAFSPLEVQHGATRLGLSVARFLERLAAAGLGSLPGTAAEVLDEAVRAVTCPDKLSAAAWLDVVETSHRVGLRTTATIMFGHVEDAAAVSRHLRAVRALQARTGGITEFVPLPFVPMEAPIYRRGRARRGPTSREALLMHAVARLALHPLIPHVQTSWVKMGPDGAAMALAAGADDLGGTLMDESISRAAGSEHGQELSPAQMERIVRAAGRVPVQRDTLYRAVQARRRAFAPAAAPAE